MGEELRVRVLFRLGKGVESLLLELNGFIHVLLAAVHGRDFDITVCNLL